MSEAKIERLHILLLKYGKHKAGCMNKNGEFRYEKCICGWERIRNEIKRKYVDIAK